MIRTIKTSNLLPLLKSELFHPIPHMRNKAAYAKSIRFFSLFCRCVDCYDKLEPISFWLSGNWVDCKWALSQHISRNVCMYENVINKCKLWFPLWWMLHQINVHIPFVACILWLQWRLRLPLFLILITFPFRFISSQRCCSSVSKCFFTRNS